MSELRTSLTFARLAMPHVVTRGGEGDGSRAGAKGHNQIMPLSDTV